MVGFEICGKVLIPPTQHYGEAMKRTAISASILAAMSTTACFANQDSDWALNCPVAFQSCQDQMSAGPCSEGSSIGPCDLLYEGNFCEVWDARPVRQKRVGCYSGWSCPDGEVLSSEGNCLSNIDQMDRVCLTKTTPNGTESVQGYDFMASRVSLATGTTEASIEIPGEDCRFFESEDPEWDHLFVLYVTPDQSHTEFEEQWTVKYHSENISPLDDADVIRYSHDADNQSPYDSHPSLKILPGDSETPSWYMFHEGTGNYTNAPVTFRVCRGCIYGGTDF